MPDASALRALAARILVCFAVFCLGFSLGRHSLPTGADPVPATTAAAAGERIAVYYMHASLRCETCNRMEAMTAGFLRSRYAKAMASGVMAWESVDFQENEALAARFGVVGGCVVVAREKDGAVLDFRRVEEVWTLVGDKDAFDDCLERAVDAVGGVAAAAREDET